LCITITFFYIFVGFYFYWFFSLPCVSLSTASASGCVYPSSPGYVLLYGSCSNFYFNVVLFIYKSK
jgi:hypothetical protein